MYIKLSPSNIGAIGREISAMVSKMQDPIVASLQQDNVVTVTACIQFAVEKKDDGSADLKILVTAESDFEYTVEQQQQFTENIIGPKLVFDSNK